MTEDHATQPLSASFQMREQLDADECVRLILAGELDIAVADRLATRLAQLRRARTPTRLDLSELSFVDSTGIQTLYAAVRAAEDAGTSFEISPELTTQVRRVIELIDGFRLLWPAGHDRSQA